MRSGRSQVCRGRSPSAEIVSLYQIKKGFISLALLCCPPFFLIYPKGASPEAVLALLLFALPLLFTLQKLLLLLADRSHQLTADPQRRLRSIIARRCGL